MQPDAAQLDDVSGCLIEDPVELLDGVFQLKLPGGSRPLRLGAKPVTSFSPGWYPRALYLGFAPLLLLEFRSEQGGTGCWFLNHSLEHVANTVGELPADMRHMIRLRVQPLLREVMSVIDSPNPVRPGAAALAFMGLSDGVKAQIAEPLIADLVPKAIIYPVADLTAGQAPVVSPVDQPAITLPLSRDHLATGFLVGWQGRLLTLAQSGSLSWPSPIDGIDLPCRGSIIFDDFFFAYRFVDDRFALVFYVIVSEHHSIVGGIWFPSMGVMVVENDAQRPLGARIADQFPRRLLFYVLTWAPFLLPYFSRVPNRFSNVLRGPPAVHIGHQLWNELTGIQQLLESVPSPRLNHLVIGQDNRLELYGPIDEIFPPLQGRVRRDLGSIRDMILDAYCSGAVLFRITREYVPAGLRTRLLGDARRRAEKASIRFPEGPTVMIGLRVENRTVVDLEGFLKRMVTMVDQRFPNLNLVFDGHNAGDESGRPISSHGESMARTAPDVVERRLVDTLREYFPHRRDRIFDTIMQPISSSLAWAHASSGFISIWGASLAKYRWVANLPGFVITSAHNLRHRNDLNIYHSSRYMESPSPLEFVDVAHVRDDPQAEQLVPVGGAQPSFANFRLDETAVLAEIERFIAGIIEPQRAQGGTAA